MAEVESVEQCFEIGYPGDLEIPDVKYVIHMAKGIHFTPCDIDLMAVPVSGYKLLLCHMAILN